MPLLVGARLRPIAIGELLRRLTVKCLMHEVRADAKTYLWPAQVGVAVKAGGEAAVHALRAWGGRHAASNNSVVVKVDFGNAFNTVSRDVVLRAAALPYLGPLGILVLPGSQHLAVWQCNLSSTSGVQQGDPRPAAFCRCAAACCGSLVKWTR